MMPNYVTDSAYVDPEEVRTLVGTGTRVFDKVVLLNLDEHTRTDISFETLAGIHDDPLAEIRKPDETEENEENGEGDW